MRWFCCVGLENIKIAFEAEEQQQAEAAQQKHPTAVIHTW